MAFASWPKSFFLHMVPHVTYFASAISLIQQGQHHTWAFKPKILADKYRILWDLIGSYGCLEVLCGVSGGRSIAGSLPSSTGDVFLDARWSLPALPSRRQAAMIYRRLRDGLEDRVDHMNHMSHNVS